MAAAKENNGGRKPSADKLWRDALMLIAKRDPSDKPHDKWKPRNIDLAAIALWSKATGGDVAALREIGDRLDGKPHQAVTADVDMKATVNILSHVD